VIGGGTLDDSVDRRPSDACGSRLGGESSGRTGVIKSLNKKT
jgi:hypothetical protein